MPRSRPIAQSATATSCRAAAGRGAPGSAGYELLNWFALFGTAGTPGEIVNRLNGIVNKALADPAMSGKLLPQGIVPRPMNAAEFKDFVDGERTKFGKIVVAANIKLSN